ncbi:acyl-CoA dehydrogenase [Mycobacterium sp. ENV421]|uniref:acyl-CoA dehydrogenase family protein n=1 Tax=Mycobacterium sp. ENV421 TaxID=1213407 RepID=UPI000C9BC95D|nr:acyl-CoA dehydrogenase family protein [Mycobacterium sp. ENV421]PND54691.1 acyl-CoA dehydrogenase [Mycobacterium sp. ENV421]
MSDIDLVERTAADLLDRHCTPELISAAEGSWSPQLWQRLEDIGLTRIGVDEQLGGAGGGIADAATVLCVAAGYAAPVPLAEALFPVAAGCTAAGLALPDGPVTVAYGAGLTLTPDGAGAVLGGVASRVPYARVSRRVLVVTDDPQPALGALVDPADCRLVNIDNLAGEPRDDLAAEGVRIPRSAVAEVPPGTACQLRRLGALARAVQLSGALDAVLEATVRYAGERVQFDRPIGQFQAVAHQIAELAGLAAGAGAATQAAVAAVAADPATATLAIAAAKARTSAAAGPAARIAHQVHGAIGFTQEHRLHHLTRRLWAWREECGSAEYWARQLGRAVIASGSDGLWPMITAM